jgi:hypothetical protein
MTSSSSASCSEQEHHQSNKNKSYMVAVLDPNVGLNLKQHDCCGQRYVNHRHVSKRQLLCQYLIDPAQNEKRPFVLIPFKKRCSVNSTSNTNDLVHAKAMFTETYTICELNAISPPPSLRLPNTNTSTTGTVDCSSNTFRSFLVADKYVVSDNKLYTITPDRQQSTTINKSMARIGSNHIKYNES